MKIVSGKTSTNMVNMDKVLQLGQQQIVSFKCLKTDLLPISHQRGYDEEK